MILSFLMSSAWIGHTMVQNEKRISRDHSLSKMADKSIPTNPTSSVVIAATYSSSISSSLLSTTEDLSGIDWTDPIFNHSVPSWDNDPIVLQSHKILFFAVPKVACTVFKQLFRRIMGFPGWRREDHIQPHDPRRNRLKYLGQFSKEQQHEFMTSPNWTRAIFVRDPLERALSAYLDKALNRQDRYFLDVPGAYIKIKCCDLKARSTDAERQQEARELQEHHMEHCLFLTPYERPMDESSFPFDIFVKSFLRNCDNEHWRPQSQRLKPENWKYINFVGQFDHLQADTQALLNRIGAYKEYGANGWGHHGNQSIFERNTAWHATSSKDRMNVYYKKRPDLEALVRKHYQADYNHPMLGLS